MEHIALRRVGLNLLFSRLLILGLNFVTHSQIVHGDLAARNVLVFPNFVAKVTDFGLARRM